MGVEKLFSLNKSQGNEVVTALCFVSVNLRKLHAKEDKLRGKLERFVKGKMLECGLDQNEALIASSALNLMVKNYVEIYRDSEDLMFTSKKELLRELQEFIAVELPKGIHSVQNC